MIEIEVREFRIKAEKLLSKGKHFSEEKEGCLLPFPVFDSTGLPVDKNV